MGGVTVWRATVEGDCGTCSQQKTAYRFWYLQMRPPIIFSDRCFNSPPPPADDDGGKHVDNGENGCLS